MLKQTSEKFKRFFLLQFTKELINNYAPKELFKLEQLVENQDKKITDGAERVGREKEDSNIKEIVKSHERSNRKIRHRELEPVHLKTSTERLRENLVEMKRVRPVLRIPEPRLPPTMDYLRPTPNSKGSKTEIELGKLNPLIKDPMVKVIECKGPEENITVKGAMGTKPTKIVLNKEEISEVIKKFSEATKIPADEGVFKATTGTLTMSAIVSETIGSKFIIKKMSYQPNFMPQR